MDVVLRYIAIPGPLTATLWLLLTALPAPGEEAPSTGKRLAIVYSGDTNGVIRACRCPGNLFGGLPQRAKVIQDVRRRGAPAILVDSGNLFPNKDDKLRAEYVLRCYAVMGYDAIGIGEREFACGPDYLAKMIRESELPFTSANLVMWEGGRPVASSYLLRQVGGVRVGIVSVASPKAVSDLPGIAALDPGEALAKQTASLRGQADLIVALSQLGLEGDKALAAARDVDVIVGGRSGEVLREPLKVGKALIVHAGRNAEHVGLLEVTIGQGGGVASWKNTITPLTAQIADEPETAQVAQDYKSARAEAMGRMPALSPPAEVPQFVPAAQCRKCHEKEFSTWAQTKHARAIETLQKDKREDEPECLYCHATGYGMRGGFVGLKETPGLASVQCQSCHLVAVTHGDDKKNVIVPQPISRETCIGCHTEFNSPGFNYSTYLPRVKHASAPTPLRE